MKKFACIIFLSVMLIMITSCVKDKIVPKYKIAMVSDSDSVNDQSLNQLCWKGLVEYANTHKDVQVNYLVSKIDSDYAINLQLLMDNEYDLIIGVGYKLATSVKEVAIDNPDKKFVLIDDVSVDLPNVLCIDFAMEEASYLAGVVAALTTQTKIVGFVEGTNSKLLQTFGVGFIEGVKSINENINVFQDNANTYSDTSIVKSIANNMISFGADIIYFAAGGAGAGGISACVENEIYAVGVDMDQAYIAPKNVLTSAVKKIDKAIYQVVDDFIKNGYKSGFLHFDLANGGVGLADTKDLLSQDVIDKVIQVEQNIISKKIIVPQKIEDCKYWEIKG